MHIILKESERMQGLIEDLLDLSKIEQQGFKLNMGTVDMKGLLEDIHMVLDNKARKRNLFTSKCIKTCLCHWRSKSFAANLY